MPIAQIVRQEKGQAVLLPPEIAIDEGEVFVKRVGRSVLLIPRDADPWQMMADSLEQFSDDYMIERRQPEEQPRETFE
jgi:antitoxin VapB